MTILLNIITVTKDDLDGVTRTIESTGKLRENHEVRQIVVDSSVEETKEQIKKIAGIEKNLEHVWLEPLGIAPAFNLGLKVSKAEWIWCLNGGDTVHPHLKEDKFLYILQNSGADVVIFGLESGETGEIPKHPPIWALWPSPLTWVPHPATIVRQKLFEKYGLFSEKYQIAMDTELWFRLFSRNTVIDMISIPIALYEGGGASAVNFNKTAKEWRRIFKVYSWALLKKRFGDWKRMLNAWKHFNQKNI